MLVNITKMIEKLTPHLTEKEAHVLVAIHTHMMTNTTNTVGWNFIGSNVAIDLCEGELIAIDVTSLNNEEN